MIKAMNGKKLIKMYLKTTFKSLLIIFIVNSNAVVANEISVNYLQFTLENETSYAANAGLALDVSEAMLFSAWMERHDGDFGNKRAYEFAVEWLKDDLFLQSYYATSDDTAYEDHQAGLAVNKFMDNLPLTVGASINTTKTIDENYNLVSIAVEQNEQFYNVNADWFLDDQFSIGGSIGYINKTSDNLCPQCANSSNPSAFSEIIPPISSAGPSASVNGGYSQGEFSAVAEFSIDALEHQKKLTSSIELRYEVGKHIFSSGFSIVRQNGHNILTDFSNILTRLNASNIIDVTRTLARLDITDQFSNPNYANMQSYTFIVDHRYAITPALTITTNIQLEDETYTLDNIVFETYRDFFLDQIATPITSSESIVTSIGISYQF